MQNNPMKSGGCELFDGNGHAKARPYSHGIAYSSDNVSVVKTLAGYLVD